MNQHETNSVAKWMVLCLLVFLLLAAGAWWKYQRSKPPGSLRLDVPQDLVGSLYRWQVVRFGSPSQVIEDLDRDHRTTVLPPGEYQVGSVSEGTSNWITWPEKVQVQPGQQTAFTMNSSLRLDVPQDLVSSLYRWQVVRFGSASQVLEDLDRDHRTTVLPPGEYQVRSVSEGTSNWITWPQKTEVQSGSEAVFKLDSGVRLVGPGAGANYEFHVLDKNGGMVLSWQRALTQLLPPGRYTVEGRPDASTAWKPISQVTEVRPGWSTEVTVPTLEK